MIDEIVYSELAKSFAAHGEFLVRDVPSNGYGFVYPILIAPAWRLFAAVPDAYAAAKAINGVLMSLAAVPAYFLARRLLQPPLALVVAALTVLVPSMLYTGTLMTENAFYPLFLVVALALVIVLEEPTPLRQVVLLALCGLAYGTRAQAVALVAAVATAPLLLAAIERRGWRRGLRPFATLYGVLAGGAALALIATVARGRSPLELLGAYRAATTNDYSVDRVLRFLLYHVAELDLYVGVVPFAALLALWLAPRAASSAARAFAAASLALFVWLVAEVAIFASQTSVDKIEERNMFYLAPLALIALVASRRRRGRHAPPPADDRRGRGRGRAAVLHPVPTASSPRARSPTRFALLPWWWVQDHLITSTRCAGSRSRSRSLRQPLFVLVPRRLRAPAPGARRRVLSRHRLPSSRMAVTGSTRRRSASSGPASASPHPDWIDRAVGRDASVAVLWTGPAGQEAIWENEFFSRSVGPVYDLAPAPDPLPATPVARRADGMLVADGRVVRAQYVLADGSVDVAGRGVARDPLIGLRLYRVDGPIVLLTHVDGLYPNDTWSRRTVTYERVQCRGGRLSVLLQSDPSLFQHDAGRRRPRAGPRRGPRPGRPRGEGAPDRPASPRRRPMHGPLRRRAHRRPGGRRPRQPRPPCARRPLPLVRLPPVRIASTSRRSRTSGPASTTTSAARSRASRRRRSVRDTRWSPSRRPRPRDAA